jgi:hypothetical protein
MLTLDGGGIRGIMTLEVLVGIEDLLREKSGAIIAAGVARGMSARELLEFYQQTGPAMFDKRFILKRLKSLYKSEPLKKELAKVFGEETTLLPEHLRCLLLAVTRNVTTDSPWPISSNPLAKYNDPERPDCNLRIPLWKLVRASTAAPIFFPPEVIPWDPDDPEKTFVFVDGGMTPYNNPSFLLYRMATEPAYRLGWKTGESKLLLVSIGTGAAPTEDEDVLSPEKNAISNLAGIPGALMYGALVDQDVNCRVVGRCVAGDPIDREIGDLIPRDEEGTPVPLSQDLGKAFLYARYNAELTPEGLADLGLPDVDPKNVSKLDSVEFIDDLRRVGRAIAGKVSLDHFGSFV